ncbi:MAG: hypothetical protein J7J76_05450 [Candidatus Latescibacteria bacterium]|nr:hypothetical protein [Candidatus Latescibacterota bacterium]
MRSKKWLKNLATIAFVASMLSLPLLAGCTKHPSPQELTRLEEASHAAEAAEKTLQQKKEEKAALEAELSAKKARLKKLEAKRDAVKANATKK